MLVESLVVSSHEFSCISFYLFFLSFFKKSWQLFYASYFFLFTVFFSFFVFFSFDYLKHWRTLNTHMNRPVKLLLLPVLVDSTRLPPCYNKSIEEAKACIFNSWFQNIHFSCTNFPRPNFGTIVGDGNGLISRFC